MTTGEKIQKVKWMLANYINKNRWFDNSSMDMKDEMLTIVNYVSLKNLGFSSEIAATVLKYEKCSEKQAYWIAKAAVENDLTTRIDYQFRDDNEF